MVDGITVVAVHDETKTARFFVGAVDIRLQFDPQTRRFQDAGRWWLDGRRNAGRPRINPALWHQLMRKAGGIRKTHRW